MAEKEAPRSVTQVTIDEQRCGQRLDNFLLATLKGVPRTHVYRILRRGEVRINRGRARPDYRLQLGDVVRVPPVRRAAPVTPLTGERYRWLEQHILFEDADLVVLDKPAGLAVHAGTGTAVGVIEALRSVRPAGAMLELVHRLDKDTSGCLVLAKSRPALLHLHAALRAADGGVRKEYRALVRGRWEGGARDVALPLARTGERGGERRVAADAAGKSAHTEFFPERRWQDATLVRVVLATGRTHQARVHAAALGHAIAGDAKYGDRDFNALARSRGVRRLFLHAARLELTHPRSGQRRSFEAPLPQELREVLEAWPA